MKFPFYKQLNRMDCGPACLRMLSKFHGRQHGSAKIRQLTGYTKGGLSLLDLSNAAEMLGFNTRGVQLTIDLLCKANLPPSIVHWNQNHFVVLIEKKGRQGKNLRFTIADPARGILTLPEKEFSQHYLGSNKNGQKAGSVLLLEPTTRFFEQEDDKKEKLAWGRILKYLKTSKWKLAQVMIAFCITSGFQLIFPFLTQSIVDTGINTQNLQFITIILIAQLMLVFSRTIVDFIRSRLLLNISVRLNFSLLSEFWTKLTRLPISYFDSTHTGDIMQRLSDSKRIESFLTGTALSTFFSMFNFLIFATVLMWYNIQLFFVFSVGGILYFLWVRLFLGYRRRINYQTFHLAAKSNQVSLQLVQGMQELKLNTAEQFKRWEWENVQASLFNMSFRNLSYSQLQQAGALLINEGKNIVITFLVAQMVVRGTLSFGAMLAVQYIIGQLNGPVEQFVGFLQNGQDAKISLERLNEIHGLTEEEDLNGASDGGTKYLPENNSILCDNLTFSYQAGNGVPVLNNITLNIPEGKTTAIVGVSGSGKTTLLKILLKFYDNYSGEIKIGSLNSEEHNLRFKFINPAFWRKQCGAVLQDGYIFGDSIAQNIAIGYEEIDFGRLIDSCKTANILPFIESLPNGFNTKLGSDGVGISQGQKQRILIARAIYKNPKYLFFDEATNALDANNEKTIVENLKDFFRGRTVVVVAHRLSTVMNADKIVVLHEGRIVEEGTHEELTFLKGKYYELVKNQLDLGRT